MKEGRKRETSVSGRLETPKNQENTTCKKAVNQRETRSNHSKANILLS
jgi:hypothetical protein